MLRAKSASSGTRPSSVTKVVVKLPDKRSRKIIDVVAKYVARHGAQFEGALKREVRSSGVFGFLSKPTSSEGRYYRWRAFAFAQGDGPSKWRREEFHMFRGGAAAVRCTEAAATGFC
mmetsp:Transcript_124801/g.285943  ORF Transcript_124801/g.285943 Transcript_124801/m.285943 type:complete len:117 (+) Transcript_124801:133-483(+)